MLCHWALSILSLLSLTCSSSFSFLCSDYGCVVASAPNLSPSTSHIFSLDHTPCPYLCHDAYPFLEFHLSVPCDYSQKGTMLLYKVWFININLHSSCSNKHQFSIPITTNSSIRNSLVVHVIGYDMLQWTILTFMNAMAVEVLLFVIPPKVLDVLCTSRPFQMHSCVVKQRVLVMYVNEQT